MSQPLIYVMGSLSNPAVPAWGRWLREQDWDAFDDWYAAGPDADVRWREYERARGRTMQAALKGRSARQTFGFDAFHLNIADAGLLVLPAGKSGHMELCYLMWSRQKPTAILMTDPDPPKWDQMYPLLDCSILSNTEELTSWLLLIDPRRTTSSPPSRP